MTETKQRLYALMQRLPIDSQQEAAIKEGIEKLSDERAGELADKLEKALDKVPHVLATLQDARKKRGG